MKLSPVWVLFLLVAAAAGREVNLVNNADFNGSLLHWFHEGTGSLEFRAKEGVRQSGSARLSGGRLVHYLDLGNMEHSNVESNVACNRFFRLSLQARGKGIIRLGIRSRLMYGRNAIEFEEKWSELQMLSADWNEFFFELQERNPASVFHDKIMVEYLGSDAAVIDRVSLVYRDKNAFQISFKPAHALVLPGDQVQVRIQTSRPNQPLQLHLYPGHTIIGANFTEQNITTDADGVFNYSFRVSASCIDGMRLAVSDPETGVKRSFFASLTPPGMLAEMRQLASRLNGKKHLLFMGDSLSDYDRGRNYIDIVTSLLPESWTVRNAGVGGDDTRRVWLRLQGKRTTRNEMYDQLLEPKPDLIFLFLGANDAKAPYASGYRVPVVPPELQEHLFRRILQHLRQQVAARIVIISATAGYLPYQQELAAPKAVAGINHNLFGLERHLVNFNAVSQKIATAENLDYIDVYHPSKNHPDSHRLFVPDDGVHLTLQGHQLVALEVLCYLAETK